MADRYWVTGGTGNYNSTTNWSASSGGASGETVPTATDAVFFDANSGAGTAIINVGSAALSLDTTGFTGTLRFNNTLTVSGNVTIGVSTNFNTTSGTPILAVNATSSLTSNGVTFPYRLQLSGSSVTYTLIDDWTVQELYLGAGSAGRIVNDNNFFVQGNLRSVTSAGVTSGTTRLVITSDGGWINTQGGVIALNIDIDTTGTVYLGATTSANQFDIGGELNLINGILDAGLNKGTITLNGNYGGASISGFAQNRLYLLEFWNVVTIKCDLHIYGITGSTGATIDKVGEVSIYIESFLLQAGSQTRTYNIPVYLVGASVEWRNATGRFIMNEGLYIRCGRLYIGDLPGFDSGTKVRFNGSLIYESGQVTVSNNIFEISASSTLTNMHKISFNNIEVASNATLTMNEFFCGLPNRSTFISTASTATRFTVNFTTDKIRYARYVSFRRMVLPAGQKLVITTPQSFFRSNTNNQTTINNDRQPNATIIYTNTTPNGASLGLGTDYNYASSYVPNALTHTDPNCFTSINLD